MSIIVHPDQASDFAQIASLLTDKQKVSLVTARGVQVELPQGLRQVLDAAAQALLGGREVIVGTKDTYVTTQQAADYLGVSRPTMVRILDLGELPCERPGSHRRIKLADLADYQQKAASRRASLDRLLETSDELAAHDGGFVATR
ncbi:MAG: helix-turn-helix domain-containing protein [Propionibacteriaceae bacterium]|nr:helix-turn-helix domain-containing protein [Propionibacteriaceae bacterium]